MEQFTGVTRMHARYLLQTTVCWVTPRYNSGRVSNLLNVILLEGLSGFTHKTQPE